MRTIVVAVLATLISAPAAALQISSPDTRIAFTIETDAAGVPRYSVRYHGEPVVQSSRLGLRFAERMALDSGMRIVRSERQGSNTVWRQPWGERRRVRDHYNELYVLLQAEAPTRQLAVRVRVYDDGLGFRYELPEQRYYGDVAIIDEVTEFVLPQDATAWWIPARGWNRYEYLYRETPVRDVAMAHTPMTLRLADGVHVSLHEAALVDYAAYVLDQRRPGVFRTNLTPWSNGVRAYITTPFVTPWRTIQVADSATGLLNSDLILNLNEPNKLGDVSWVQPGKYVGIWWLMHLRTHTWSAGPKHGATTERAKRYIDFAAANGFDGVLVEGWNKGWEGELQADGGRFSYTEAYPDFDLEAVAGYAIQKGVRLVGHHETFGNVTHYERQMAAAFDLYEKLGVRQVKTGYVADGGDLVRIDDGITYHEWHDGQFAVRHFQHVLEEAAQHRISINTHEPVKDTGLRRTYPNWISREGARGQEYNAAWAPPSPPGHNAILPFTRFLSGPMDFTPGIFNLMHQGPDSELRVPSTLMQQLALYVVFYSPIQMAADLPENYEARPDAFQFVRDVPTDWEESVALAGEVGDFVVWARKQRGGDDWYLGAITDEQARQIEVPLRFLEADRRFVATIYRDGDNADWKTNPYDYVIERRNVSNGDTLELHLAAGGGTAIRFQPVD